MTEQGVRHDDDVALARTGARRRRRLGGAATEEAAAADAPACSEKEVLCARVARRRVEGGGEGGALRGRPVDAGSRWRQSERRARRDVGSALVKAAWSRVVTRMATAALAPSRARGERQGVARAGERALQGSDDPRSGSRAAAASG